MKKYVILTLMVFCTMIIFAQAPEELPTSKFSTDSTVISLSISNYNHKYMEKVRIFNSMADFDRQNQVTEYNIPNNGKLRIVFRPFVPETIFLTFDGQEQIPLVVVPGGNLSLKLNMDKGTHEIKVVGTAGTLEKVNHEINVDNAKDMIKYNNDSTHIVTEIMPNKHMTRKAGDLLFQYRDSISATDRYSKATKEWLQMYNITEYLLHIFMINKVCSQTIRGEISKSDSEILKYPDVSSILSHITVAADEWKKAKEIALSPKMTLYPNYMDWVSPEFEEGNDKILVHNNDILIFHKAMLCYMDNDMEQFRLWMKFMKNEEMKTFFK